jgi:hypothetical protein
MKPKDKGGLGVINLTLQNEALLPKQLDKFYRKKDIQWVHLVWNAYYHGDDAPHLAKEKGSFWWKDFMRLNITYRGITHCNPAAGNIVSPWNDLLLDSIFSFKFANLFEFAKNKNISLASAWSQNNLVDFFRLPMTRDAFSEFQILQGEMLILESSNTHADVWTFFWGSSTYSSRKFYQHQFACLVPPKPLKWIWKSKCIPKIKFCDWLLLVDRLNTRNVLRRCNKFLEEGYNCAMYNIGDEETTLHLFFHYESARVRCETLGIRWPRVPNCYQKLIIARRTCSTPFFMEVFLIAAWCIWKEHNAQIFEGSFFC